jgi:hypothetical protein
MLYVFNTWVVANLLHPVLIYILFGSMSGEFFNDNFLQFYFLCCVYSFIFSLPALLVAWLLFHIIRRIRVSALSKFITWSFFASIVPVLIWYFLFMVFDSGDLQKEDLEMMLPSSLAIISSILIRVRQFFILFTQLKNQNHENKMV